MEFVTILDTEDQKIVMPKKIADKLNYLANSERQLSQMEFEQTTQDVLEYVKDFFNLKGKKVLSTSKAKILSRGKAGELPEIFEPMIDAVILVSEAFDNTEGNVTTQWKLDLEIMIKLYYQLQSCQKCVAHFYDVPTNGVSGFITLELDDNILILPLILNESGETQSIY